MTVDKTWQLQEAKSRFSEVVERAKEGEAQVITRRGQKAVVVIDYGRYLQLTGQAKGLLEVLRGDPPFDDDLVIERDRSPAREITFE